MELQENDGNGAIRWLFPSGGRSKIFICLYIFDEGNLGVLISFKGVVVESLDSTMVSKRYLDTEYFLMRFNLVTNSHFDTSRTPWRLSGLQPVTVKSLLVW